MKMRLKYLTGNFKYQEPMSGQWFFVTRYDLLLKKLYRMYQQNGWPVGLSFEQEIEQQLCQNHPELCESDSPKLRRRRRLTWGDLMRGTRVLLSFKLAGSPIVEPEEADRRAALCAKCPANCQFDKPCGGICGELADMVRAAVGSRRTKSHDQLKACGICHCLLEAAVQIPLEHQCKGVTPEMKTDFAELGENCWKQCL